MAQRRNPWIETPLIESAALSRAAGWQVHTQKEASLKRSIDT